MASVIGSSQRYGSQQGQTPLVSQLAAKNTQKYQHSQIQRTQRSQNNGQSNLSPLRKNIDNLYDQNIDQSPIQAGSSLTIAPSQRNSQISIRDYQINNDSAIKSNLIKQNQSPWRRNLNNSNNIVIGSKNGFYNNNDSSTIYSLSAQKQQQFSMSPNTNKQNQLSINQNESQHQKGNNNMNSSYFLHIDQQQNQPENTPTISSKNHHRNHSYQHRKNNIQQNSPLAQQNSIIIANDVTQNTVSSNTNKSQQRKNYLNHHQRKVPGTDDTAITQNSNNGGDTAFNSQSKQRKHPLTARGSVEMSSYQKKLRLMSLNANIHRIFKEDKFQQQLNNQFTSDSTDQSQQNIPYLKDNQSRASQEILNLKDQSLASIKDLRIEKTSIAHNIEEQDKNKMQETIPTKNENTVEQKGVIDILAASCTDNENIQDSDEKENKNKPTNINSLLPGNESEQKGNGELFQIQSEGIGSNNKIQYYTEDAHLSAGQSINQQKNKRKGSKSSIKMLYTEPENESRRQNKGKKFKINKKQSNNPSQQMYTQAEYSSNGRGLALSNSPRNNLNYNYRQRANTQASTVDIPPQINIGEMGDHDKFLSKESQNDSPIYTANRQKQSQEDIYKYGVNSNHLYFISNSPLLKCKVPSNGSGFISEKDGMNAAMKNYINNTLMIKQSYLNIQQQIQGKQCRTQVDSSLSLMNQSENRKSPLKGNIKDRDIASLQHLSLNQGDSIYQQQQNYQFSSIDEKNQMKDTLSKFQVNNFEKPPIVPQPFRDQNSIQEQNSCEQNQIKNKLTKKSGGANQRGHSLQQKQRAYINNEISNSNNNNNNINNKVSTNHKFSNGNNKNINASQDMKQHRIKLRNKVYSTNSSNHSLNASILEKSQLYVEKYKNNLQNDLSLIQKIDKQKQIRENDLYNVNYNEKKLEYALEIDKKIQYLSHQKIEPSDLKSNQQRYLQNYSPRINQNSQSGNYQGFHKQQSPIQNNPYSPILSRGNTQQNDYTNIHTSLSHITNELSHQDIQISDNFGNYLQNHQKNEPSTTSNTNRENDSQLSYIWRKLTYNKDQGKLNQSSLEEELRKIEFLSKKNEKALNQYVQIKEDAIQISQFMESQLNQKRERNNSQGNI